MNECSLPGIIKYHGSSNLAVKYARSSSTPFDFSSWALRSFTLFVASSTSFRAAALERTRE